MIAKCALTSLFNMLGIDLIILPGLP